jgi:hypothetical protein
MEKKIFECSFENCVNYKNGLCSKPELYDGCKYSKLIKTMLKIDATCFDCGFSASQQGFDISKTEKCPICGSRLTLEVKGRKRERKSNLTNARDTQLKNCIVTEVKRFSMIMSETVGADIIVSCSPTKGIKIYSNEREILIEEIYEKLAEHYGVSSVESIHIDDSSDIKVWIVYQ